MSGGTPFFCTDSEQVMGSSVRGAGRGLPRSTAAALRASLSRSQALKRFAVLLHSFGVRLLRSARQPPPPTADSSTYKRHLHRKYLPILPTTLDRNQTRRERFLHTHGPRRGFGYVLAERKRRTPKEWRETCAAFWAPDRLRAARRAAAVEPGHTRTPADNGAVFSLYSSHQHSNCCRSQSSIHPLFR